VLRANTPDDETGVVMKFVVGTIDALSLTSEIVTALAFWENASSATPAVMEAK
jgi:hypothetical protein